MPDGKRKRRTKAEIEADNARAALTGGFGSGSAGPAPFRPSAPPAGSAGETDPPAAGSSQGAPFGIQTHAVAPDPAMTAMLGGIFGKPQ